MNDPAYLNYNQVTQEEMETILMLTRKMDGGGSSMHPTAAENEQASAETDAQDTRHHSEGVHSVNKRKKAKPQRALSSSGLPLAQGGATSQYRREPFFFDERGSSSEQEHATHNMMSIQSMLNTSSGIPNTDGTTGGVAGGDYGDKSWHRSSDSYKRRSNEVKDNYSGDFPGDAHQSWQEKLEKAMRSKQEKEMLDELAAILEMPTKNFPHNTARLCYAKLEALKLLRQTCDRGLISEELYAEKQQEFLDSMQF